MFERYLEPDLRSTAKVNALRTFGSSKGFTSWLGEANNTQFQSLSWTLILSPSALTRSSLAFGGKPRNSISARPPRIACSRTDIFGAARAV